MSSKLIDTTILSPFWNYRDHKIDTITIHCMAGNMSIESCGEWFQSNRAKCSSNYGIDSNGRIGLYVPEEKRSWASSNRDNDMRAVTIEVANDGDNWRVSDKAIEALIKLCADICERNGIDALRWQANKSLIGQIDKQNMTVHRWFKATECPGDHLYNKLFYIANKVNELLDAGRVQYYPKYGGSSASLVDALTSLGIDASPANRKKIAAKNGMPQYSRLEAENLKLMELLKAGTLKK